MKKLILILSLALCVHASAQEEVAVESGWKSKVRGLITQVAGADWSNKILGELPKEEKVEVEMPMIPQKVNKTTDVSTYTKVAKEQTEYDRLPAQKKRQFDYKFLEELFQVTRKTEAKDEDLANWLNTLEQGGSREGIYQALVLDEVYSSLESMEERPSKKLLNFSLDFSKKFLNQNFKSDSLEQLNLYSLKRIFTEKGLDLMEHYELNDLDALYRWYANVSAYLAQNYKDQLKSPIREEPSATYHYEWAKGMPLQHIKSEFIIKMHKVMNALQQHQE